jgi:ABC-type phosphate transport system substrate-binding protein
MKKLVLTAAVSAALVGSFAQVAQAVYSVDSVTGIPTAGTVTDSHQIYLSGATAVEGSIRQLVQNRKVPVAKRICSITQPVYEYIGSGNTNLLAYLCVLETANPALTALAATKPNLLLYKNGISGSARGVNPIATDSSIAFMKVTDGTCTLGTLPTVATASTNGVYGRVTCSVASTNTLQSDFGMSDVDPIQFFGDNTPSSFESMTPALVSNMTVTPAQALIFGTPVTLNFRNALQEAQFGKGSSCITNDSAACMPSLSSHQIASIFSGKLNSWKDLKLGTSGNVWDNASPAYKSTVTNGDRVHVCRRDNGSGTGAQLGIKFLNYPCTGGDVLNSTGSIVTNVVELARVVARNDTGVSTTALAKSLTDAGPAIFHANSGSSNVNVCLDGLDKGIAMNTDTFDGVSGAGDRYEGKRWAIGIVSLENNPKRNLNYRFIKIDGVEPTLDKVARGQYKDWVEMTIQYNTSHHAALPAASRTIIEQIISSSGTPAVIGGLNASYVHSFGRSGVLAVPALGTAKTNGTIDANAPVNPYSHAVKTGSVGPNACRVPTMYDDDVAAQGVQFK